MSEPWPELGWLLDAASLARLEDLPDLVAEAMMKLGALHAVTYVVDYRQTCLVAMTHPPGESEPLGLDGTVAGRAYTTLASQETVSDDGVRVCLPIFNGSDRLGVLEVTFDAVPTDLVRRRVLALTRLFGELLASHQSQGDAIELARRRQPMQLAGEMAWSILPPLTMVAGLASIAGVLEPSYEVGGDGFDYALNGDRLHVAFFDAVGHGLEASSLGALTMSSYRNARRSQLGLVETADFIDAAIRALAKPFAFATAVLAELDVNTGIYRRISAGHPGELLVRDGKLVKQLPAPTAIPLGLSHFHDQVRGIHEESLEPGDALVIYSDGLVDARNESGENFGTDRLTDFVVRCFANALPPEETLRRLIRTVVDDFQYEHLRDDATAVLVRWRSDATVL
jgi:phosphoserine phosphatase RsbU/P